MLRRLVAVALLLCAISARAWGYAFVGPKWTTTPVTLHLQLGTNSSPLLDGSASWGAVAENALATWNSYLANVKFAPVRNSTAQKAGDNSLNNVFFDQNLYGEGFGFGVLAVTLIHYEGSRITECDVVFNNTVTWNSYRGAQRHTSSLTPIYDFSRVALHEFGHVLGLDHPDTAGQNVPALMNSHVSDLDVLVTDDINGGRALYGAASGTTPPPPAPVMAAPVITAQPTGLTTTVGQSATFIVAASGAAPLTYQWLKSGTAVPGATATVHHLPSVTLADAGAYSVVVSNAGGSVTSAAATLIVREAVAPVVVVQPVASQTVSRGATVTFSATVTGTEPLRYQWQHYSTSLPGATSPTLTLQNVQPEHAGVYTLRVANLAGTTAAVARLFVRTAPVISQEPADHTANVGADVSWSVAATGTPEPALQWQKNGAAIAGATGPNFTVRAVQPGDAGTYRVVVTNSEGTVTSRGAILTVRVPPQITAQPLAQTAVAGTSAGFAVTATGLPAPTYQWRKDDAAIPGATSPTLSLGSIREADAGTYSVVVTNAAGTITSAGASLTVHTLPAIARQPVGQVVNAGTALTLSVAANGNPTPTYQWRRNGIEIPGATGTQLSLPSTQPADAGHYTVTARNAAGTTTSVSATVAVNFSRLLNLSTRGYVDAGGALTTGFVVRGSAGKRLLIRAVGPSLQVFGVEDALESPTLAVIASGAITPSLTSAGWNGTADLRDAFASVGAFPLAPDSPDAAATALLPASGYSVRIDSMARDASGVVLAELYDAAEPSTASRLINASTLGYTGPAERSLTPGFVIGGNVPKRLLVRVVGPSLAQFGVPEALADPALRILPQGRADAVAANDNWGGAADLKAAFARVGAFALPDASFDAAAVADLPPGAYSIVIAGADGATGYVLVELYDVDP